MGSGLGPGQSILMSEGLMDFTKKLACCKGQLLIFVALAFVVLGLFVGLAIDGGRAYLLNARLSKIVDAAALAAATDLSNFSAAKERACDLARVNGLTVDGDPGTCPVTVEEVTETSSMCPILPCIAVTRTEPMDTSFMSLCGTACKSINVAATGIAAPATFLDGVPVLDNTNSMKGKKLAAAKEGATALVNKLILPGSDANQISLVPFRGCYNPDGSDNCVKLGDIVNLTSTPGKILSGIDDLKDGGGSGTNICLALDEGRNRLFGLGARADARKIMIILTDGDNHPSHTAPAPCDPLTTQPDNDNTVNDLDRKTNDRATAIKAENVEIFVIRYAEPSDSDNLVPDPPNCTTWTGSNRDPDNDPGDRKLGRCIASSGPGHYFFAPTPEAIKAAFEEIARRLARRLTA